MVNIMEATTQLCTAFNYYHFLDLGEGGFIFLYATMLVFVILNLGVELKRKN